MRRPEQQVAIQWLRQAEVSQWIRENFQQYATNTALAKHLNVGIAGLRGFLLYELKLSRMQMDYWPEAAVAELRESYLSAGDTEIAARFEVKFPKSKPWTCKHIEKKRKYLGLHRPPTALHAIARKQYGREPSRPPQLHGLRDAKDGDVHNWRSQTGRWTAFVRIGAKWTPAGRYFWIEANGPVPEGYRLIHEDGNGTNYTLTNMKLVPTKDVPRLTKNGARDLTDRYVAAMILGSRHKLSKEQHQRQRSLLLQQPHLLHFKRLQITLDRTIRAHQSNEQ